jgi:hypothetical protein
MRLINIYHADRVSMSALDCARAIEEGHYLHKMPHFKTSYEIYVIMTDDLLKRIGYLVFGRPQATRCQDWFGSVEDVRAGRCEVTRYQVLNLARVWIDPRFQADGELCNPEYVPGFYDRRGLWRSTLASTVIKQWIRQYSQNYLMVRPPVFLNEPYELKWLLSYCDTRLHRGVIYQQAGFELFRTNEDGIQTWRIRLNGLDGMQNKMVIAASERDQRAIRIRAQRDQLKFDYQGAV